MTKYAEQSGHYPATGPCRLIQFVGANRKRQEDVFPCLKSLARELNYRRFRPDEGPYSGLIPLAPLRRRFCVLTEQGKSLDVEEVLAWWLNWCHQLYLSRRFAGHVYRGGPVPGVHRRGRYCGFRRIRTTAERRLNALVLVEEGEVAARACRQGYSLPDSWDDYSRNRERCWKRQHKGRKAWDRPKLGKEAAR